MDPKETAQQFHIRDEKGLLSAPLTLSQIVEGLLRGDYQGTEMIAPYPEETFQPMASHPLFYDVLIGLLERPELTQVRKDDITQILKIDPARKKKGVTPSKVIPKLSQLHLFSKRDPLHQEKKKKKSKKITLLFLMLFFLVLLLFFLWVPQQKKGGKESPLTPKIQYISIEMPPENVSEPNPSKAKQHISKAKSMFTKDTVRSYREALTELQAGLKLYPSSSEGLALMAKCYLYLWPLIEKNNDNLNKISTLTKNALKLKPDSAEAGQAEALLLHRKNQSDEALAILGKLAQKNPYDGETYFIEGEILVDREKNAQGRAALEKALELSPSLTRAHYLIAKSYQAENEPEKAYEHYWIGLNLYPEHALSRLEASLIDIQTLNNLSKAEGNLKIVIQFPSLVFPEDLAKSYYHLGWIYEEGRQLDFALKHYKKAVETWPTQAYGSAYQRLGGESASKALSPDDTISEESLYFVTIGNRYFEDGKITDAIAQYKAALQTDPNNYSALFRLGKLYESEKKWKSAIEYYQKAISIKGTHTESYIGIARIYIDLYDFKQALDYIEKVKTIEPRSALILGLSGRYYTQKGDLGRAISEYKNAIEIDPQNYQLFFELASLYLKQKEYKKAEQYFLSANRLNPDASPLRIQIAVLYFSQGLKAQAVDYLKKLAQAYPLDPNYPAGLGKIYFLAAHHEFALEYYLKALELQPDHEVALAGLAQTYEATGEFLKALKATKSLIKHDPSNAEWTFNLGKLYLQTGNSEEAHRHFKLTTQINVNFPLAHYETGSLALQLGYRREAEKEFKKEIEINPHLKEPYLALANLLASQSRFEEAQENYRLYIRLDPTHTEAYLKLGTIHVMQKQFETAIEFYKTALERNPDEAIAYLQLGWIYKELDRKSDAIEAFEHYLRTSPDAPNVEQVKAVIHQLKKY